MLVGDFLYEELVPYNFSAARRPPRHHQASGCRGSTADGKAAIARIDYDLDYIATASLWLDAKISMVGCKDQPADNRPRVSLG